MKTNESNEVTKTKSYLITFEDIFTFAVDKKAVKLTEKQFIAAMYAKKTGSVVVSKLVKDCHIQLIITNIDKIN